MHLLSKMMMAGMNGHLKVTLSGQTIGAIAIDPDSAWARLKIDNDGNVYESEDSGTPSYVQIDTGTDWLRPADSAPADYEVRYTNLTGEALYAVTGSTAQDAWYALSGGDFILTQACLNVPSSPQSSTFDIEIRKGSSGSALDSASYTLTATVDSGS